jgi:hypothetical protein
MVHVIGIDQSLSCTGVTHLTFTDNMDHTDSHFYFSTDKKKHTSNGNIIPWFIGKKRGFDKAYAICTNIQNLFSSIEGQIYIGMEGYSFASLGRSIFQLGELGGIIKYLALNIGITVDVYEPTVIKKHATGKGNGKKESMYLAYKQKFPDSPVLKYYDAIDNKLLIEPQLARATGKPLCDLIDSHFIADMVYSRRVLTIA